MQANDNRFLSHMLERLYGQVLSGPTMNCRPHRSRQRLDLHALHALADPAAQTLLADLFSGSTARLTGRVPPPGGAEKRILLDEHGELIEDDRTDEPGSAIVVPRAAPAEQEAGSRLDRVYEHALSEALGASGSAQESVGAGRSRSPAPAARSYSGQMAVLHKLEMIAEEASSYEQQTAVNVLSIGIGLLHLPSNWVSTQTGRPGRGVLAPLLFLPVSLTVRRGVRWTVQIAARSDGADFLIPNAALLSWIERQSGISPQVDEDAAAENPWKEAGDVLAYVARALELGKQEAWSDSTRWLRCPESSELPGEPAILPSAVLGLFPLPREALIRDVQALVRGEVKLGPLKPFVQLRLDAPVQDERDEYEHAQASVADGQPPACVAPADPCQARAVRLAQRSGLTVVHGPPGTGKSQTITNVISDHLFRGERVLLVCEKRTAIDVVHNRLVHAGLGQLCAVVHDAQKDQRDLYKSVREQLEEIPEQQAEPQAAHELARVQEELSTLMQELGQIHAALHGSAEPGAASLHTCIGRWLGLPEHGLPIEPALAGQISPQELQRHRLGMDEVLHRGQEHRWHESVWPRRSGLDLALLRQADTAELQRWLESILPAAEAVDRHPFPLPIDPSADRGVLAVAWMHSAELIEAVAQEHMVLLADVVRLAELGTQKLSELARQAAQLAERFGAKGAGPSVPAAVASALADLKPEQAASALMGLAGYVGLLRAGLTRMSGLLARCPAADPAIAAAYAAADPASVVAAREALERVAEHAGRLESSEADALLDGYAEGLDLRNVSGMLEALRTYLAGQAKWYRFLLGGRSGPARAALQTLGLGLNAESARRAVAWLEVQQDRLIVAQALRSLPGAAQAGPPDVLPAWRLHRAIVTAMEAGGEGAEQGPAGQPELALTADDRAKLASALQGAAPAYYRAAAATCESIGVRVEGVDLLALAAQLERHADRCAARSLLAELHPDLPEVEQEPSGRLLRSVSRNLELVRRLLGDPTQRRLAGSLAKAAAGRDAPRVRSHAKALRSGAARCEALSALQTALVPPASLAELVRFRRSPLAAFCAGEAAVPMLRQMIDSIDQIDQFGRAASVLQELPAALAAMLTQALDAGLSAQVATEAIERAVLASHIRKELARTGLGDRAEHRRLQERLDRCQLLQEQSRGLLRRAIRSRWLEAQRERVLRGPANRLSSLGADLRRRLVLQGRRAMKLRRVIELGRQGAEPDVLYDLRPVWMAGPAAVAEVFPAAEMFDLVIFDEASQCRLEEAIPVLLRGRRVLIAGDGKQLPPTRFFESAVAASEAEETDDEQALFEQQQSEIEDLLTAALNLPCDECYLDVHYRSRSADLIDFSNRHFYKGRLQPLPAPPTRNAHAAVRLVRVNGVYQRRSNLAEATAAVDLVRELLSADEPPSIGIATFNLVQRDLILEELAVAAEQDAAFARRLEEARRRAGEGSFEGLFVRNLENVQGDERDHMILSTTFGPDDRGRFRQQFGVLGRSGGGRRLNVLVTRARHMVHVLTSIPEDRYRALLPLPDDQTPGGAWLLYAYLNWAASLSSPAGDEVEAAEGAAVQTQGSGSGAGGAGGGGGSSSSVVDALWAVFAGGGSTSQAMRYLGSEGLCVDLLPDADRPVAVLADFARYRRAEDPVEWDLFREAALRSTGWNCVRTWSPELYANPQRELERIRNAVGKVAASGSNEADR